MTRGDWHWLSVGWCVLVAVGFSAIFGHKLDWARDTRFRERLRHNLVMALAGAAVGWAYFYVALPLGGAALACFLLPIWGIIPGIFLSIFTLCLPLTAAMWLHVWMLEHFLEPEIRRRREDQFAAERRIRRAQLGLPHDDD